MRTAIRTPVLSRRFRTIRDRARVTHRAEIARAQLDAVLAFHRAELDALTPRALVALAARLHQVVRSVTSGPGGRQEGLQIALPASDTILAVERLTRPAERAALVGRLTALQRRVREALRPDDAAPRTHRIGFQIDGGRSFLPLDDARGLPTTALEIGGVSVAFTRHPGGPAVAPLASLEVPDFEAAFLLKLAQLVTTYGDLIRTCAADGCDQRFVRSMRQDYCSPACSQRERSRRSYQKHRRTRIREARARRQQRHPAES